MLCNYTSINEPKIDYFVSDSNLPFADYISKTQAMIESRRKDLIDAKTEPQVIINANSPFELLPNQTENSGGKYRCGVLLIHGLLDSPFSLFDVGRSLQKNGILSRAILLPGHGTTPNDLLPVSYHDWIQAVRYGVEALRRNTDHIYLAGYSTGAALSIYHALQDSQIKGIVLLAPAIKIRDPIDSMVNWRWLVKYITSHREWISKDKEIDYVKYQSVPFNPVVQLSSLINVIIKLNQNHPLNCPVFMAMSREDETVSSHDAINFFSSLRNADNRMLLYSSCDHRYPDPRIQTRLTHYPDLHIKHLSHVSIPFAPDNLHYGQYGDYCEASRIHSSKTIYGAYNRIETRIYDVLYHIGLLKNKRSTLTYNPDFDYLANQIINFVLAERG